MLVFQRRRRARPAARAACRSRDRSRAASAACASSRQVATKMRSSQTIGEAWPLPGTSTFQAMFSSGAPRGRNVRSPGWCRRRAGRASRASFRPLAVDGRAISEQHGCQAEIARHRRDSPAQTGLAEDAVAGENRGDFRRRLRPLYQLEMAAGMRPKLSHCAHDRSGLCGQAAWCTASTL